VRATDSKQVSIFERKTLFERENETSSSAATETQLSSRSAFPLN